MAIVGRTSKSTFFEQYEIVKLFMCEGGNPTSSRHSDLTDVRAVVPTKLEI